jgi:hypothetical protein
MLLFSIHILQRRSAIWQCSSPMASAKISELWFPFPFFQWRICGACGFVDLGRQRWRRLSPIFGAVQIANWLGCLQFP